MKKALIISVSFVLILLLAAVSTAIASPADALMDKPSHDKTPGAQATENAIKKETRETGKDHKRINLCGLVDSLDGGSITIKLDDGSLTTCAIDAETKITVPGTKDATTADLTIGSKIHLQAKETEEGCLAIKINMVPGKPEKKHHVGTVSAYEAGASITITAKDGTEATFVITEETKILPEDRADQLAVGSLVTIISPRDVTGGDWVAAGIVVHPGSAETEQD